MQTKRGGGNVPPEERGDCVAACFASILAIPIDEIGNHHGEGWWDRLLDDLARHGYCIGLLDLRFEPPPGYWIASVPSLNLPPEPDGKPALHCIVCRGYDFVHDPSIGENRYGPASWVEVWNADQVDKGWALVPLDAAAFAERVAA